MKNVYLLYGLDKSLIDIELSKIKNKIKVDDINITMYDFVCDKMDSLLEDILTPSMFSDKKLIIVNNADIFMSDKKVDISSLEKYLENPGKNIYLIFSCCVEKIDSRKKIIKLVEKNGKVIELKKGDQTYILNYTKNYIEENGYEINSFVLNKLLTKVGSNLNQVVNELDKIFMYKISDKVITENDIDKLVIKNIEDDVFKLTDAIIKKDKQKSINLYRDFINNNYEITYLIGLLASQFRFLFQVKRLYNQNKSNDEITNILQVHPYRVKLAIGNTFQYTEDELLKYLDKLFNIDKNLKLGFLNKSIGMELFLLDI